MKVDSLISEDVVVVTVALSVGVVVTSAASDSRTGIPDISNISDDEVAAWDLSEMNDIPDVSTAISVSVALA